MGDEERLSGAGSDQSVEDGETYRHDTHGCVEVTRIWRETQRLETVQNTHRDDLIVIRFIPGENGEWIDELAEPLEDFLDAID